MWVYEFHTRANFYGGICWFSVWSYLSLWISKKRGFLWRHLLRLSLELLKFTSLKQMRIFTNTLVDSQFEVMRVSQFQTKANCYEDICLVSVWTFLRLWLWNQSKFSRRHLLSLSFKLCKFMTFQQKRILMKTFVECQFEII